MKICTKQKGLFFEKLIIFFSLPRPNTFATQINRKEMSPSGNVIKKIAYGE